MDDAPAEDPPRRRGGGLWRLLPFAIVVLLVVGNYRYAVGLDDGRRSEILFAFTLSVFLVTYGRGWDETAGSRDRSLVAASAATALLACVAVILWLAGAIYMPLGFDWRVASMDVVAVWILAYYFHGWVSASRRTG